jgi:hypothetical protein
VDFDSIVSRSGHGTVRVILISDEGRDEAERAVEEMNKLGCTWESTGDGLVSVDVPPEADQRGVMTRLREAGAHSGVHVDVGYLAHAEE